MIYKKTAGIIIFIREKDDFKFLLLEAESLSQKVKKTIWSLPKGNVEEGETDIAAALRETEEETGIKKEELILIPGFKNEEKYFYKENENLVSKTAHYFLAEYKGNKEIKLSFEHINYGWFSLEEAKEIIKIKSVKEMIQKAEGFAKTQNLLL